eukprot:TRINITY_DN35698_c0_g2_i1.p1 TRINITY_DN35698_c0_g2~~TRINITY_DN35698_c0_g2_i1.p1  ORF type:complete len:529 (+),score=115.66 TRINITY_DN35698_c0_g2_i1:56-1642(+)
MGGGSNDSRAPVRSLRVLKLIALLHENRSRLSEVINFLPGFAIKEFGEGGTLEVASRAVFKHELKEGRGNAEKATCPVEHLGWSILTRICAAGDSACVAAISFDRADALQSGQQWEPGLARLFLAESAGRCLDELTEDEFVELARLVTVLCYLGNFNEQKEIVSAHAGQKVEDLLRVLKEGKERMGEVVVFLPQQVRDLLLGSNFSDRCLAEFDALVDPNAENDGNATVALKVLMPVLVALGMSQRLSVTVEQCIRFRQLIASDDDYENATISRTEMVNFSQFMLALAFLDSDPGNVAADNARLVLGERRVEELLGMLEQDKQAVSKTELLLPADVADYLSNDGFKEQCKNRFEELDANDEGVVHAEKLLYLISDLSGADPFAVSIDQCERFAHIFSDQVALTCTEFMQLARHLCIMSFLHSERGREHLSWALSSVRRGSGTRSFAEDVSEVDYFSRQTRQLSACTTISAMIGSDVAVAETQFFQRRSQQLEGENEDLRRKMRELEETVREVENRLDERAHQESKGNS